MNGIGNLEPLVFASGFLIKRLKYMVIYNFFTKEYKNIEELFQLFEEETNESIDGFRVGITAKLQNKNRYQEFFGNNEKHYKGYLIGESYAEFNKDKLKNWLE